MENANGGLELPINWVRTWATQVGVSSPKALSRDTGHGACTEEVWVTRNTHERKTNGERRSDLVEMVARTSRKASGHKGEVRKYLVDNGSQN